MQQFIKHVALTTLSAVVVTMAGSYQARAENLRPNFVVFLTDDQNYSLGKYIKKTRAAIRHLGLNAVAFEEAYVPTSLCCPSRSSLLTGLYASHHGVHHNSETYLGANDGGAVAFRNRGLEGRALPVWLDSVGYQTILVGKYLNAYEQLTPVGSYVPQVWDDFHTYFQYGSGGYFNYQLSENGVVKSYGSAPEDYSTDVFRDIAIQSIRNAPPDDPIFLYIAPFAPHEPSTPAPRHSALFPGLGVPRTPAYAEADRSDKPRWVERLVWPIEYEQHFDEQYRKAAQSMLSIDEMMEAVIQEMGIAGRLDNTVFVFMSDNGYGYGEHRVRKKRDAYQASIHVPMAIFSKNRDIIPSSQKNHSLVMNIDVAPTLAELAGINTASLGLDGISLLPLLQTPTSSIRDEILLEAWSDPDDGDGGKHLSTYKGILTPQYKYIEYFTGEHEFYDRALDPYELENQINSVSYAAEIQNMATRLSVLRPN